jgi:hypothetical protein
VIQTLRRSSIDPTILKWVDVVGYGPYGDEVRGAGRQAWAGNEYAPGCRALISLGRDATYFERNISLTCVCEK